MFLAVYGIDSVLTIIQRLYLRENIFQPHRKHLYQLLANEKQIPHIIVSSIYMTVQGLLIVGYLVCLQFNATVLLYYIVFTLIVMILSYIINEKNIHFLTFILR
jgi:hypothetical protein